MVALAAVIVPVRADLGGLPAEVRNGLTDAFRKADPAVRQGAQGHGRTFGKGFSGTASNELQRGLSPALGKVGGQFSSFAGVATGALGVTTAGVGALVGAAAVMGVKTAASMEQAQIGFETLLGSGAKARSFLADLQQFAAATPFELPGLIDSSRLLLGVGVSAHDTMGILQAFGNASSAVGVGQENFQRIMLATSQAIGAGRFMTQDLNQITENGIPIWTVLSRAMGKPVPVLRQLASHGQLLSNQVLPILERQMNKDYGGAMERQSRSLNGVWSTFMDTLNIGLANVLRPLIPVMTVGLTGATNVLSVALSVIPRVFSSAGTSGGMFTSVIRNLAGWITGQLVPAFQRVYAQVLPQVQRAIRTVAAAFRDHQDAVQGLRSVVQGVGLVFQALGWILVNLLIPQLGRTAQLILAVMGPAMRVLLTTIGVIRTAVIAVATYAPRIAGAITGAFTGAYQAVTGFGTAINNSVIGAVTGSVRAMSGFGTAINNSVTGAFHGAATWLVGVGSAIVNGLISGFNAVYPHLVIAAGHTRDGFTIAFRAAGSWLLAAGRLIIGGLIQGIRAMFGPTATVIAGFINTWILQPWLRIGTWLVVRGRQLITGLLTGVAAIARTVGAFLQARVITPVTAMFLRSGTWLVLRGQQLVTGLLNGVGVIGRTVGAFLQTRVITPATNMFIRSGTWLVLRGQQTVTGLLNGVATAGRTVGAWVQTRVINPITSRFTGAVGWLRAAGSNIVSGLLGGISGAIANVRNWVSAHITTPIINAVKYFFGIHSPSTVMAGIGGNMIAGLLQGMLRSNPVQLIGKVFGGMPQALGAIVNKGLIGLAGLPGKAMDALMGLGSGFGGVVGGLFSAGPALSGGTGGVGTARWSREVIEALTMLGQPASLLQTTLRRMNQESGGNPAAINKWDVNWTRGTPSVGLMQVIGPTYARYHDPAHNAGPFAYGVSEDPLSNILASMRYAIGQYGSLAAAYNRAGGYDAGGWLPPGGLGVNLTGRPERVLDPQQSEAYTRGGGAGNVRVVVMLDGSVIDDRVHVIVEDAVGELGNRIGNGVGG